MNPFRNVSAGAWLLLCSFLSLNTACTRGAVSPLPGTFDQEQAAAEAQAARQEQSLHGPSEITSTETRQQVAAAIAHKIKFTQSAHIGILYFRDQPAHRLAVLQWLQDNGATVRFENARFGYLDAELAWASLGKLIATSGNLGLDVTSLMKLELEELEIANDSSPTPTTPDPNSSLFGPAHSAGYGAKVEEFRADVAADFHLTPADIEGQGSLVAVFDGGIDMTRTDVYGTRIRDWVVGDEDNWRTAEQTLSELMAAESLTQTPDGLTDIQAEPTLRFVKIGEQEANYDLNGSGAVTSTNADNLTFAVYLSGGEPTARLRPAPGLPFGSAIADFGRSQALGKLQLLNLFTGDFYARTTIPAPTSAGALKFRTFAGTGLIQLSLVGTANGAGHGIGNLHMVGGDFASDYGDASPQVHYRGAAPQVSFLGANTWKLSGQEYGKKWLPLARTMIEATEQNADVLDLDIYAPGSRGSNDLLSKLACRITALTNTVPVAAAHNYGPLGDTIQSIAQSPCVLGIGASHSVAALKYLTSESSIDPELTTDDAVQTAEYSGRGFGINGTAKPDLISPAYGYTAYGANFIRFSGTSGATPTTAGMIALLKQAARLAHIELGFQQVKFLLQSSTTGPRNGLLRDGYGYTNLQAAWALFKQFYGVNGQGTGLMPLALEGNSYLEFTGRPSAQTFGVNLLRVPVPGSINTPVPMRFWIEYGGADRLTGQSNGHWLKFYEPEIGAPTDTLEMDAPLHGETQRLSFAFNLNDADWAALPAGDHIALVKGVRKSLGVAGAAPNQRAVDYLLPVTITKGYGAQNGTYSIRPLYADQYQNIPIATQPGDRLLVYGQSQCQGQIVGNGATIPNGDFLNLVVDQESFYPHASYVMSTYAPLALYPGPVAITAGKNVVWLSVGRRSQLDCLGTITAQLIIRKVGFIAGAISTQAKLKDGNVTLDISAPLTLNQDPLTANAAFHAATTWKYQLGTPVLVARRSVSAEFSITIPDGVGTARVFPAKPDRFQAVLASQLPDGTIEEESSTESADAAGLGSINTVVSGNFVGISLNQPTAGNSLHFSSVTDDNGNAVSDATLEFRIPMATDITTLTTTAAIANWNIGETKALGLRAIYPAILPASLTDLGNTEWSYQLELPYSIIETVGDSVGTATVAPTTLWSSRVTVPVLYTLPAPPLSPIGPGSP